MTRRLPPVSTGAGELATVPMLARVPAARLTELAAGLAARRYPPGAVLLRQGTPAASVLIMLKGQASAVAEHRDGTRSRYPLAAAPCVIGKAAVLAQSAQPATWTAATAIRALALSAGTFLRLLREQPQVREHVLRYLAVQAVQSHAAMAARTAGTAATRVARWLLAANGRGSPPVIWLPAGQQGLAEELGLSRVTVNRALRHLARTGAIRTRPNAVVLLDPAGLAAAAG